MKHIYSLVCTRAIIDRNSNNISLIEVIERLAGPDEVPEGVGVLAIQLDLITLWARTNSAQAEQQRSRVKVLGPNGGVLGDAVIYTVNLAEFPRMRNITRFAGLPFAGPGNYSFAVERETEGGWEEVCRYPVEVTSEAPVVPVEGNALAPNVQPPLPGA